MDSKILLASGRWFDVLNPDPELMDINDIASALSKLCRFGGHCNQFYSVAEHSIHVSHLVNRWSVDPMLAKWGLLHDASEAYVADLPRPIKRQLPQYEKIEDAIQQAVAEKFGLPWPMPEAVHQADHGMLAIELRAYMPLRPEHELPPLLASQDSIEIGARGLMPEEAQKKFLAAFANFD